jgi:segregation and condensation protein B
MDRDEITNAIEAMLFAAGGPLTLGELRKIFERLWKDESEEVKSANLETLGNAIEALKERWQDDSGARGFQLIEVADGLAFRTNARYAESLRAMREQRPVRLSRAALETLAIVAYRQPVTKPEVDHIRGVDCSSPIHLLLDRGLIRITGKREEPGRPMLYGTTKAFLSFFNLSNLAQLPTLREYHELTEDSKEELAEFDGITVEDLAENAQQLGLGDDEAADKLEEAMAQLKQTEGSTRSALEAEGITLQDEPDQATATATADGEPSVEGGDDTTPATEQSASDPTGSR